mmetsp:Transcript_19178/g.34722  ORF Transcript_19178/g.34722 Transcript_19178/m.34722 type:complete len:164 (-) Transcript_19178:227-718(-)
MDDSSPRDRQEYFILEARLDENNDYTICLVLHTYNTEMGKSAMSPTSFYAKHTMFIDLCTKQKHNLRLRILHQFIRLGGNELPWRMVKLSCVCLYGNYDVKRLEEAFDVAIATTEIAINKGEHEEIVATYMLRVGLCLWAFNWPLDAVLVFPKNLKRISFVFK